MRMSKEQLEEIKNEYGVDTLWSWSRVNAYHTSPYEWFLSYVKHEPEDRTDCIYGTVGGMCHDILEKLYAGEIKYEDMLPEFEDAYSVARDVVELKFDRNTPEKDESLASRYYENLEHFFKNHDMIKENMHLEEFTTINIKGNILQGYIDAYYHSGEQIVILDWKTSSIYTGDKLINNSGQLVMYALSFMQRGYKLSDIHCAFNFLKYATITYKMKNGKYKSSNVERRLLAEKLQTPCKTWLKDGGYDVDEYLKKLIDSNGDLSVMPDDVQEKITVTDCYVEVPLTNELVQHWIEYVDDTINEINDKIELYKMLDDDEVFMEDEEQVAKESYYHATLSGYSANKHIPYKRYLERLEKQKNGEIW